MNWYLAAAFLFSGAICGAVVRLPVFVIALIATVLIVLVGSWSQGAGQALLQAVIAAVILQSGYVAGVVLRSVARSLRRKQGEAGKVVQRRAVQVPNEPKRR
jgi:ABC-type amino acid transport system permease subunit